MTTSEQAAREAVMDAANSLAAATTLAYQYKVADRPERIPAEYAVGKGLQAMDAALDALTAAIEQRVLSGIHVACHNCNGGAHFNCDGWARKPVRCSCSCPTAREHRKEKADA